MRVCKGVCTLLKWLIGNKEKEVVRVYLEIVRGAFEFIGGLLLAIFGWLVFNLPKKLPIPLPKVLRIGALLVILIGFSLMAFSFTVFT